jgi:hypothetical protein
MVQFLEMTPYEASGMPGWPRAGLPLAGWTRLLHRRAIRRPAARQVKDPIMANALFAFQDLAAAERAAASMASRLPRNAVTLHAKRGTPGESVATVVDEVAVSGGMLRNLYDLFQGVFEWGASPHDASHYEETVRKGGAVISVDANTAEECAAVDEIAAASGVEQRTDWSDR